MLGAGLDGFGVDVVTVVLVEYKEVLVSVAEEGCEGTCLVYVDLAGNWDACGIYVPGTG